MGSEAEKWTLWKLRVLGNFDGQIWKKLLADALYEQLKAKTYEILQRDVTICNNAEEAGRKFIVSNLR